jgi:hypothetical protein
MARQLRLEFLEACYQVSNRGNDRRHVFRTVGAQIAFETCLFEACAKSGSVLHAFVIMGNNHHLVVETPVGKLVAGRQWPRGRLPTVSTGSGANAGWALGTQAFKTALVKDHTLSATSRGVLEAPHLGQQRVVRTGVGAGEGGGG